MCDFECFVRVVEPRNEFEGEGKESERKGDNRVKKWREHEAKEKG